jgi:hypothetical protein
METEMLYSTGRKLSILGAQFAPRVYLLETRVAGFQYHDGPDLQVQATLATGRDLVLVREPYNEYDARAIAIHTYREDKLGYIPRDKNAILAAMLDQGLPLFAEIVTFDPRLVEEAPWNCLRIRLYILAPRLNSKSWLTLTCPRCSAPLPILADAFQAKCAYCGSTHLLRANLK